MNNQHKRYRHKATHVIWWLVRKVPAAQYPIVLDNGAMEIHITRGGLWNDYEEAKCAKTDDPSAA